MGQISLSKQARVVFASHILRLQISAGPENVAELQKMNKLLKEHLFKIMQLKITALQQIFPLTNLLCTIFVDTVKY